MTKTKTTNKPMTTFTPEEIKTKLDMLYTQLEYKKKNLDKQLAEIDVLCKEIISFETLQQKLTNGQSSSE